MTTIHPTLVGLTDTELMNTATDLLDLHEQFGIIEAKTTVERLTKAAQTGSRNQLETYVTRALNRHHEEFAEAREVIKQVAIEKANEAKQADNERKRSRLDNLVAEGNELLQRLQRDWGGAAETVQVYCGLRHFMQSDYDDEDRLLALEVYIDDLKKSINPLDPRIRRTLVNQANGLHEQLKGYYGSIRHRDKEGFQLFMAKLAAIKSAGSIAELYDWIVRGRRELANAKAALSKRVPQAKAA